MWEIAQRHKFTSYFETSENANVKTLISAVTPRYYCLLRNMRMTILHFSRKSAVSGGLALEQCFSKWAESPPWGRIWWARGRKYQRGRKCSITNRSL